MRLFTAVLFSSFLLVSGCAGNSTVSQSADLNKYEYVVLPGVMSYSGDAELMNLEVRIYDALASTRLTVLGEKEISLLTDEQKQSLLLARFSARQTADYSRISVISPITEPTVLLPPAMAHTASVLMNPATWTEPSEKSLTR